MSVISKLLECFSVDRYVPVDSQKEFEEVALKLNEKKLYYAGVFFNDTLNQNSNEITYSIRMDPDNTPVTIENRNKFWFPGPEGSFELDMRYHRGFVQIQQSVDSAIIQYQIQKRRDENGLDAMVEVQTEKDEFDFDDYDEEEATLATVTFPATTQIPQTISTTSSSIVNSTEEPTTETNILELIKSTFNISNPELEFSNGTDVVSLDDFIKAANAEDPPAENDGEVKNRTRRQLEGGFFDLITGPAEMKGIQYVSANMKLYTKQFPYPKYIKDE